MVKQKKGWVMTKAFHPTKFDKNVYDVNDTSHKTYTNQDGNNE